MTKPLKNSPTKLEIAQRKRQVAQLLLARTPPEEIAHLVNASIRTVQRDAKNLEKQWAEASRADIGKVKAQELAELDSMERDLAVAFAKDKEPKYMRLRLQVKERRARMLGLDEPETFTFEDNTDATKAALAAEEAFIDAMRAVTREMGIDLADLVPPEVAQETLPDEPEDDEDDADAEDEDEDGAT